MYSGDSTARYYSMFGVEYGCDLTNVIPMTFPLPESKLVLTMRSNTKLQLSLEFKTVQDSCILASGEIKTKRGIGVWEVRILIFCQNFSKISILKYINYNTVEIRLFQRKFVRFSKNIF